MDGDFITHGQRAFEGIGRQHSAYPPPLAGLADRQPTEQGDRNRVAVQLAGEGLRQFAESDRQRGEGVVTDDDARVVRRNRHEHPVDAAFNILLLKAARSPCSSVSALHRPQAARDVEELTPRRWKELFANNPLKLDLSGLGK